MRILHTSDWHLGRTLHGVDLSAAHAHFLDHLVRLAHESQVDAVIVSGDVFDRALPPLESVAMLDDSLVRLTAIAPVVLIPGNHDSARRLGFAAGLLRDELHICSRIVDIAHPVVLPDREGHDGLLVHAIPYLDPDMARRPVGQAAGLGEDERLARSHEAVVGAALGIVRAGLRRRRTGSRRLPSVVMAHAFVTGGQPSDSERDLRIGGIDSVPATLFAGCGADYVALGHLHGPQAVTGSAEPGRGAPVMRYAGSPLAFSFSEQNQHKSTALVNLDARGVQGIELVDCPVPRRLCDVSGTLEEVLGPRFTDRHDDWVRVLVTGPARPENLRARVKRAFPYALEVHFTPDSAGRPTPHVPRGQADPVEVTGDFVAEVSGQAPTGPERAVLRRAVEAAVREGAR